MAVARYTQSPGEVKVYRIDYSSWLDSSTAPPETIISSTSAINPITVPGLVTATAVLLSLTDISLTVSGGVVGDDYVVKVSITTSGGQVKEDCIEINVRAPCE